MIVQPVSYTHLDVYKRQGIFLTKRIVYHNETIGYVCGGFKEGAFSPSFTNASSISNMMIIIAVSYTHLLAHGERLTQLLIQNQYEPMPVAHQVLSLFAAKHKFLKPVKVEQVKLYEKEMLKYMEREHADIIHDIDEQQALDDALSQRIKDALTSFETEFKLSLIHIFRLRKRFFDIA